MTREELVRLAVLMHIADANEEPTYILHRLGIDFEIFGVAPATPEEIRKSLTDLIERGLAKAYWLGPGDAYELQGPPPFDRFQEHYFWITEDGLRSLAIWRKDWPFDDEGELIPRWAGLSE